MTTIKLSFIGAILAIQGNEMTVPMGFVDVTRSIKENKLIVDGTLEAELNVSLNANTSDETKVDGIEFRDAQSISKLTIDMSLLMQDVSANTDLQAFKDKVLSCGAKLFEGYALNDLGRFEFKAVDQNKAGEMSEMMVCEDFNVDLKTAKLTAIIGEFGNFVPIVANEIPVVVPTLESVLNIGLTQENDDAYRLTLESDSDVDVIVGMSYDDDLNFETAEATASLVAGVASGIDVVNQNIITQLRPVTLTVKRASDEAVLYSIRGEWQNNIFIPA